MYRERERSSCLFINLLIYISGEIPQARTLILVCAVFARRTIHIHNRECHNPGS